MTEVATQHKPQRMCRVCRQVKSKAELERRVLKAGELVIDRAQKLSGRGWYACQSTNCQHKISFVALAQAKAYHKKKEAMS